VLLTLPVLAAEPGQDLADGPLVPPTASLSILLVDDNDLIRNTVPLMLRTLGHRVDAVDGGRTALEHLSRAGHPDLVILDLNMPDMSGMEALRHKNIATTMIYVETSMDAKRRAQDALSRKLGLAYG